MIQQFLKILLLCISCFSFSQSDAKIVELLKGKKFEDASKIIKSDLRANGDSTRLRYCLGLCYEAEGKKGRAIAQYLKATQVNFETGSGQDFAQKSLVKLQALKPAYTYLLSKSAEIELLGFKTRDPVERAFYFKAAKEVQNSVYGVAYNIDELDASKEGADQVEEEPMADNNLIGKQHAVIYFASYDYATLWLNGFRILNSTLSEDRKIMSAKVTISNGDTLAIQAKGNPDKKEHGLFCVIYLTESKKIWWLSKRDQVSDKKQPLDWKKTKVSLRSVGEFSNSGIPYQFTRVISAPLQEYGIPVEDAILWDEAESRTIYVKSIIELSSFK